MKFRLLLFAPFLLVALASLQEIDISGEWVAYDCKKWSVSQKGELVHLVREDSCQFSGKFDGREINYRTWIKPGGLIPGCENYGDVPLEYDAKLVLSEDGKRFDNVVPEKLVDGTCVVELRRILPHFFITRSDSSMP